MKCCTSSVSAGLEGRVIRFARSASLLFLGLVLVAFCAGCGSHQKSAGQNTPKSAGKKTSGAASLGVRVIAARAAKLLYGRRLAFSLGSDIWVFEHGRAVQVTHMAGGTPHMEGDVSYDTVGTFSLSPDGKYTAFSETDSSLALNAPAPEWFVMRSDGSEVHDLDFGAGIAPLPPSWDRSSRSFVVVANDGAADAGDSLVRIQVPSGRWTQLTDAQGSYPDCEYSFSNGGCDASNPAVSPDGKKIALFRGRDPKLRAYPEPVFAYVMRADGTALTRLPLPARLYGAYGPPDSIPAALRHNLQPDLWWCGNSTMLCVGSPTGTTATYRINVRSGRTTYLRRWAESAYAALSPGGTFAIDERKTSQGAELLVGPVRGTGVARLTPILAVSGLRRQTVHEMSVSGQ